MFATFHLLYISVLAGVFQKKNQSWQAPRGGKAQRAQGFMSTGMERSADEPGVTQDLGCV